jgi:hypothetical protein
MSEPIVSVQEAFKWYADNGYLNEATALADENANPPVYALVKYRLRHLIYAQDEGFSLYPTLYVSVDGGAYEDANYSSYVAAPGSDWYDDENLTQHLLTRDGLFTQGFGYDDTFAYISYSIELYSAGDFTEVEYCIIFDVTAIGHTLSFRMFNDGIDFSEYLETTTVTVSQKPESIIKMLNE